MRKLARAVLVGAVLGATMISLTAPVMAQAPIVGRDNHSKARSDNRPGPLTERNEARRKAAQELILSGKASPNEDGVIALGEDKYFQASVTGVGQVFTILAEFGDQGTKKLGNVPGPLHNEIAEPDRDLDNSTHWVANFNRAYYRDLFFGDGETFADFYAKQSNGQYTVDGGVSKWVQVPGNASVYGDNAVEDFGGAWQFIEDSGNAWYQAQVDAGKTRAQIRAKLAEFDVWDRNDYDSDGNFDEPDGYIDHFQAVHAGEGEDAGGGAQGADAIWSHRWYVNQNDFGLTGPSVAGTDVLFGGAQIGDSGYWIGDYTVEAENGGLGVFAHEFGHDLGLPDLYDTAGGENGTAFWTVMSLGSWLGHGEDDIGTTPGYMGPWEKLQLGWLDYKVVSQGEDGEFDLSPAARQVGGQEQAVIIDVPDEGVTTDYNAPAGGHAWWTTSADDLNTTLTRSLDLSGVSSATVKASAWYDIEAGYDFLYAEYSLDGGDTWVQAGAPVDGSSKGHWKTIRYTGIPGGSADTLFRFRFQSDTGVHLANAWLDDITVKSGGNVLFADDVESGADGWTAEGGFRISTGTETVIGDRYYLVENRTYTGYDQTLAEGPYQFSFAFTAPNKVEHFPFQDGLLVWMVDETYSDNNTIEHPGHGLVLPVDARPEPFVYEDGIGRPSNRRQPFDATFGLQTTDAVTLHKEVIVGKGPNQHIELVPATAPANAGIPTFTDEDPEAYWSAANPLSSTLVAGHGVVVTVLSQVAGGILSIDVTNPE
jgi:immune inhibitor A